MLLQAAVRKAAEAEAEVEAMEAEAELLPAELLLIHQPRLLYPQKLRPYCAPGRTSSRQDLQP